MFEKLTKAKKLEKAKEMFNRAASADNKWQSMAREDFEFRDGEQWTLEEKSIMEEELRPVLTFNLTKSSIDLIMGMNEDNRIIHRASPVDPTDGFLAEVLNDIADWVQDNNAFEDEEDAALESSAICGRGFVAIDFGPDPKRFGEIEMAEVEVSVHEVHFDPAARRPNLEDAAYITWDRWLSVEDFKMRYPWIKGRKLDEILAESKSWHFTDNTGLTAQHPFEIPSEHFDDDSDYEKPLDLEYYDQGREMIRLIHMEYWEAFQRYYVWNPQAGVFEEAPEKPTKDIKKLYEEEFGEEMIIETMMDKRVKWIQFTGDQILFDEISPLPFDGFSIVPMFTYTDVSKRTMNHFGLVRLMKDPQKEINKRWSQALNMLNNQVAPGIFAETDAFVDEAQAKQSMKTSGDITWTNAGAITGGKIQERNVPTFPNAPMQMEQFSQDIMKKITGINPDLLGQDRGRQEPGVVIRLRQQQGVTLLKPLFRNFNRMKKDLFKRQLAIIMSYMPDNQILRILGQNERYQITPEGIVIDNASMIENERGEQIPTRVANIRDVRNLEYNITQEEAPGNLGKRMLELTALMEMQQAGFIVDPIQVIEKMEIPESEKQRWIAYIQQQQEQQAQAAREQFEAQMQIEMEKLRLQAEDQQMDFLVDIAKINQMAEKDEKKLFQSFAEMNIEERQAMGQFITNVMNIMAQVSKQESDERMSDAKVDEIKAEGQRKADEHNQDMKFDTQKQNQDLKFNKQKHDQAIKFAREKNKVALELQRKKGEENAKQRTEAGRGSSSKEQPKNQPKSS